MSSPSDRVLERYLLGELPEAEREAVEKAAATDSVVAERLAALRRSNVEILGRYPPAMMAARIRERLQQGAAEEPRKAQRWPALRVFAFTLQGLAVAAVLLVVLLPMRQESARPKGLEPHLVLHRRLGTAVETLTPGARAARGDLIQIGYVAAGAPYGAILSIDGRGSVTWHLPPGYTQGGGSEPLRPGGEVLLAYAYELDDAPAFERFFLVTSAKPFALGPVAAAADRLAAQGGAARTDPLRLPKGLSQASFLLLKGAAR